MELGLSDEHIAALTTAVDPLGAVDLYLSSCSNRGGSRNL